jgi:hypothetical protein
MREEKQTEFCEGLLEYFRDSGDTHTGPYSNSVPVPFAAIGIRQGEAVKQCKMPFQIALKQPVIFRLVEAGLEGKSVTYERVFARDGDGIAIGPVWRLKVHTGKLDGMVYEVSELTDW